jgi:murein L,D-transpeptidase YafK
MRSRFAVALACAAWIACAKPPAPPSPPAPPAETPVAPPPCARAERLEVSKSRRSLTVRCVGGGTLEFPIALARERGRKRTTGDQRMPEGEYHIAGAARASRFHLFIPIDYPSRADADRALAEGRITKDEHAAIGHAHREGRLPPQDTALGGALGIHGEGPRWRGDLALNWTYGCIAVTDLAIAQLAKLVRPGTPVHIAD